MPIIGWKGAGHIRCIGASLTVSLAPERGIRVSAEEQGFVSLAAKHDFSAAHLGVLLGAVQENLQGGLTNEFVGLQLLFEVRGPA